MPSFIAVAQLLLSQPMNFSAHPRIMYSRFNHTQSHNILHCLRRFPHETKAGWTQNDGSKCGIEFVIIVLVPPSVSLTISNIIHGSVIIYKINDKQKPMKKMK